MSQIRNAVLIACSLAAFGGSARAEDQSTVKRLSSHGHLSSAAAKKLVAKVNQRMARAADAPPSVMDPIRAMLSQALVGSPMPADAMATAKVRLKLYAGLNEAALEAIFAPQAGAIAGCVRDVSLTHNECEALISAAGNSTVARTRMVAGGPAPAPLVATPMAAGYAAAGGGGGGSHFGNRFNSGFQGAQPAPQQGGFGGGYRQPAYPQQNGYAAAPAYAARPAYGQAPGYAAGPQQGYQQQAYAPAPAYAPRPVQQQAYAPAPQQYAAPRPMVAAQPQPAYRPAPVAAPVLAAPMVSPQDAAARKEAYKQQREAYLARQKAQFAERKEKASGLEVNPDAASVGAPTAGKPAPAAAAKPAATASKVSAPAADEVASADTKHPVAAAAPEAPAAKSDAKPALDNSFLDGLLDDPLGGKKK